MKAPSIQCLNLDRSIVSGDIYTRTFIKPQRKNWYEVRSGTLEATQTSSHQIHAVWSSGCGKCLLIDIMELYHRGDVSYCCHIKFSGPCCIWGKSHYMQYIQISNYYAYFSRKKTACKLAIGGLSDSQVQTLCVNFPEKSKNVNASLNTI